jgi:hypothetical protein
LCWSPRKPGRNQDTSLQKWSAFAAIFSKFPEFLSAGVERAVTVPKERLLAPIAAACWAV